MAQSGAVLPRPPPVQPLVLALSLIDSLLLSVVSVFS